MTKEERNNWDAFVLEGWESFILEWLNGHNTEEAVSVTIHNHIDDSKVGIHIQYEKDFKDIRIDRRHFRAKELLAEELKSFRLE